MATTTTVLGTGTGTVTNTVRITIVTSADLLYMNAHLPATVAASTSHQIFKIEHAVNAKVMWSKTVFAPAADFQPSTSVSILVWNMSVQQNTKFQVTNLYMQNMLMLKSQASYRIPTILVILLGNIVSL